jgi:antitoxin ParD1/3/4
MPTRNISLTEHFDQFVEDSIESGSYLNASEVVREGLRLLEHKTQEEALKLARLKEATEAGFAAIDRGEFRDIRPNRLSGTISAIGKRAAARARGRGAR